MMISNWCSTSLIYKFLQIWQKKKINLLKVPLCFWGYSEVRKAEEENLCIIAMQQLNSPKGNHVARIRLLPKTSVYIHRRASEVLSTYVVFSFERLTIQSQSRTSELVLSHQIPPLGGIFPDGPQARQCQKRNCLTLAALAIFIERLDKEK